MKPIARMLSEHFERHRFDIHYDDNGTFIYEFEHLLLFVRARENYRQVVCHCIPSFRCPEVALDATARLIANVNDHLNASWWSLNTEDGLLSHNTFLWACDNDLSDQQIKNTVTIAISGTVTMLPFIQAVGEKGIAPSDSFKMFLAAAGHCNTEEGPEDNPENGATSDETWDVATVDGSKLVH